jgi:hypothetical protein
LTFFVKNASTIEEKQVRIHDFTIVMKYFCQVFTGDCLRKFQASYFEDESELTPPEICCSGCEFAKTYEMKPAEQLRSVLKVILFLKVIKSL